MDQSPKIVPDRLGSIMFYFLRHNLSLDFIRIQCFGNKIAYDNCVKYRVFRVWSFMRRIRLLNVYVQDLPESAIKAAKVSPTALQLWRDTVARDTSRETAIRPFDSFDLFTFYKLPEYKRDRFLVEVLDNFEQDLKNALLLDNKPKPGRRRLKQVLTAWNDIIEAVQMSHSCRASSHVPSTTEDEIEAENPTPKRRWWWPFTRRSSPRKLSFLEQFAHPLAAFDSCVAFWSSPDASEIPAPHVEEEPEVKESKPEHPGWRKPFDAVRDFFHRKKGKGDSDRGSVYSDTYAPTSAFVTAAEGHEEGLCGDATCVLNEPMHDAPAKVHKKEHEDNFFGDHIDGSEDHKHHDDTNLDIPDLDETLDAASLSELEPEPKSDLVVSTPRKTWAGVRRAIRRFFRTAFTAKHSFFDQENYFYYQHAIHWNIIHWFHTPNIHQ
jgi:hypothetical protein